MQRKNLVRTSSTPGSTRQLNLYETRSADGMVIHLVDLPGYGFSHRSKGEKTSWATLIEGYLGSRPREDQYQGGDELAGQGRSGCRRQMINDQAPMTGIRRTSALLSCVASG